MDGRLHGRAVPFCSTRVCLFGQSLEFGGLELHVRMDVGLSVA